MKDDTKDLFKDIWPQERDLMFRPERLKYIRALKNPDSCVFCDVVKAKENSFKNLCLYKNNHSMVVLNKYPYNVGHLLVLPLHHEGDLFDLSEPTYQSLMGVLKKSGEILKTNYTCPGLNIGMNHGSAAGAGIPQHLHWHVIPRWIGDTNFFPVIAETKVMAESLEQSYKRLAPAFLKLKEEL